MGNIAFGLDPQKHIAFEYLAFNSPAIWWKHHLCVWYPESLLNKQETLKCQRQWRTREEHVELPKLFIGNCDGLKQLNRIHIFHCKIWQDEQIKFVMSSPGKRSQGSFLPPHSPNYQTAEASAFLLAQGILVGDRAPMARFHQDMHGRTFTII